MNQRSRLQLLMVAINRWLEQPKTSRSSITSEIVQAAEDCGLTDVLANEGVTFNRTDDLYNDMRVNAQKIFRWLGQYDGIHDFRDRVWDLEQAVVIAMPEHIRLDYLNDIYSMAGVVVCTRHSRQEGIDAKRMAVNLTKEQMEAQVSMIELGTNPGFDAAKKAHREVAGAVATGAAVLGELERTFPDLAGKKDSNGQEPTQRHLKVL